MVEQLKLLGTVPQGAGRISENALGYRVEAFI